MVNKMGLNQYKINHLKDGIKGMEMYLSVYKSCAIKDIPTDWNFVQTICKAFIKAFLNEGLLDYQIKCIMGNCFTAIIEISKELNLDIDEDIQDFIY